MEIGVSWEGAKKKKKKESVSRDRMTHGLSSGQLSADISRY